ncbi:MAG: TetR/AcrR family transcriptional regulator [Solirubrobacteraceae bacterium]
MIRRRGLRATSVRELAKHSGAPLGSTYHYFPGGKQQLAAEAVRFSGGTVSQVLRDDLEVGPRETVRALLEVWRQTLIKTEFRAGCPVLAVSIEEPEGDETRALAAAAEVFSGWEALLSESLRRHGADGAAAVRVATLVVASVEGAIAMCRAQQSVEPLDRVASQLDSLVVAVTTGHAA